MLLEIAQVALAVVIAIPCALLALNARARRTQT